MSCTDLAVSFPARGVIRLASRDLFGDSESPTCRRFVERVFQAEEISDVTITVGDSPWAEHVPETGPRHEWSRRDQRPRRGQRPHWL